MAVGGIMKILLVFLAIHAMVAAEPVGLKEETGVFPEGKQVEALVDEVLMEVETNAQNTNNNDNTNNYKDTRGALRKKQEAQEIVTELDQGISSLLTRISSDIPPINLWAFGGIITFLLSFTVLFENSKEKVVEQNRGSSQEPIVTSIFSELTVLGFLAMVCFLLTKFGLDHISLMVFGNGEGEEHAENKEKLGEMLEAIHMVIFLVMVMFICEALGMIQIAEIEADKWAGYEGGVLTLHQRLELAKKWKELKESEDKPGSFTRAWGLTAAAREYNATELKMRFMLMRQEFINDEANSNNALKRDFRFHMYLTKVMGERLGEMIELPWAQWVLLEVVVMFFIIFAATVAHGSWLFVLCTWVGMSWTLLFASVSFHHYLQRCHHRLTHACDGVTTLTAEDAKNYAKLDKTIKKKAGKGASASEGSGSGAGSGADETEKEEKEEKTEESSLLEKAEAREEEEEEDEDVMFDEEEVVDADHPGGSRTWIQSRPRYLDMEELDEGPWWVPSGFRAMPKNMKNKDMIRFYNLFSFGKSEKRWHLFFIRFLCLSEALFISVFCLNVVPMYVDEAFSIGEAFLITAVGVLPAFIVLFFYLFKIVNLSVLCTSVEFFRTRRMVHSVVRHQKEDRAVMLLRIIVALNTDDKEDKAMDLTLAKMQTVLGDPDAQHKQKIGALLENDTSLELEHLADIFDNLDKDGSGSLSNAELEECLRQFGINATTGSESEALRNSITKATGGATKGGNPDKVAMTKAEFLTWMVNKARQAEELSAEEVAEFVFEKWDTDNQKHLSVEELLDGFSSLGEAFTTNEVSTLVVELDLNDDGQFDIEEFVMWVERHTKENPEEESCCGCCC